MFEHRVLKEVLFLQEKKDEPAKPTAPLTMEIDPQLRILQEQAKMFSRFNSNDEPAEPAEKKVPEKEPRKKTYYLTNLHVQTLT